MLDALPVLGTFLGGLGLFLLAVGMLTEGLRLAAGDGLRAILARSTRTPAHGIASGVLVTAIVQSSSAVTVATIGFVNAGLLTLVQALGVVFGSNIGTTFTGWLVAAVGFSWKIELIALPLVGVGMLLRLTGASTRLGAAGEALAGFGLFFIGVDVLREAFEGVAAAVDLASFAPEGWRGVLAFLGIGVFMTVVTQSSSAAIAITLTAAAGGVIGIDAAAAAVIGANVGTTSTALLASVGATSAARRVASAHVVFNVLTAGVALALLPLMLWLVAAVGDALGLAEQPAVTLALFHTSFNVLGVLLMLPLTGPLARFLDARFLSTSETEGRPLHLDRTLTGTPTLAIDALTLELLRLLALVRRHVSGVLDPDAVDDRRLDAEREAIDALSGAVVDFMTRLERQRMTEDVAKAMPVVLRVLNYLEDVTELADDARRQARALRRLQDAPLAARVHQFRGATLGVIAACDPALEVFDAQSVAGERERLRSDWHGLKDMLLEAAAAGQLPVEHIDDVIDVLRGGLRIAEQVQKAATRLQDLGRSRRPVGDDGAGSLAEPRAAADDPPKGIPDDEAPSAGPPAAPGEMRDPGSDGDPGADPSRDPAEGR